jgi:membrane protein DedA with SNARE-associated domain
VLAGLSSSLTHQIALHGAYAVFVLMAVDAVFPAASELVMLYAGAVAAGAFSSSISLFGARIGTGAGAFVALATAGTLGYLVGGLAGWTIGRTGGRALLEQHGAVFHLGPARLERAQQWFERWGPVGVFVGRLTPLVRSFVSIPAGAFGMPLGIYTSLTLAGSAAWAFGLAGAGWAVGSGYRQFHHGFQFAEYAVVAVVIVGVVYLLGHRLYAPSAAGREP